MTRSALIRPIDPTDPDLVDRIVEIQQAAYAVEAELIGFDGIPQLTETSDDVRTRHDLHWLGAFSGDRLVGVIAWEDHGDGREIDRLAVDPTRAREGIGRRLVRSVPVGGTIAVSTGAANQPAINLYEREGYSRVGTAEIEPGVHLALFERVD